MLLAATTTARAVTRTPDRCKQRPAQVLCAIHFHHKRANLYRARLGMRALPYAWVAERHPARRARILTYWTRVHAHWKHEWATRPHEYVPQPYAANLMCIHRHEGAMNAYNPAGPYYGGWQMDAAFMRHWGAMMLRKYGGRDARYWSAHDQLWVAYRAARRIGYHSWPVSAAKCGLL